jgi:hypothetical protein
MVMPMRLWLAILVLGLLGPVADAEDSVLVSITGPMTGRVGDRVSFEVELVNRSGKTLAQLRVIDYFDPGFHHAASGSPIEQKGTIDLAPNTARRLTLDFQLVEEGRQCHRVAILDQSQQTLGGAQYCVEVSPNAAFTPPPAAPPSTVTAPLPGVTAPLSTMSSPPPLVTPPSPSTTVPLTAAAAALELSLAGPAQVLSGDVVKYVAIIKNTGNARSEPTSLEFSWDQSLSPLEASDGYSLAGSSVTWTIPAIEPKAAQERQINLRAEVATGSFRDSPATRGCVRAVLTGLPGGSMIADDACVAIKATAVRPQRRSASDSGLRMSLADLDDPVRSGDATTLVCTVTNGGTDPSGRLDIVVLLPEGARLVGDPIPSRVRVENSRVMFESVGSIPAGSRQTFELAYRLPSAGTGRASAILTGSDLDGSLERTCQTTFLEP